MIVLDLMRSSYRDIGLIREGQGLNADDLTDGLFVFNALLDSWNIERLNVWNIERRIYGPLAVGSATYSIAAPRPPRLERAAVIVVGDNSMPWERRVEILTANQWRDIEFKKIGSGLVEQCWYEPSMPTGTLHLNPTPAVANQMALYVWTQLSQVASENVTLTLPPAYLDALRHNLSVKLAGEWNKPLRQDTVAKAVAAKAAIQALNAVVLDGAAASGPLPAIAIPGGQA